MAAEIREVGHVVKHGLEEHGLTGWAEDIPVRGLAHAYLCMRIERRWTFSTRCGGRALALARDVERRAPAIRKPSKVVEGRAAAACSSTTTRNGEGSIQVAAAHSVRPNARGAQVSAPLKLGRSRLAASFLADFTLASMPKAIFRELAIVTPLWIRDGRFALFDCSEIKNIKKGAPFRAQHETRWLPGRSRRGRPITRRAAGEPPPRLAAFPALVACAHALIEIGRAAAEGGTRLRGLERWA
jgi:hypothetical protein